MNRYGQIITWGTLTAPALFKGIITDYSYRDSKTKQLEHDAAGDNMAMILHLHKGEISFEAKVTHESTNFLDLSKGAQIVTSAISGGVILVRRAVETWRIGQVKRASIQAAHYPDMSHSGGGAVGELTAFTPDQSSLTIVRPAGKLIYSTVGITQASGILHSLTIEQILEITEDEPSPDGKYLGATSHAYERNISLELLATAGKPAVDTVLALSGAPEHGQNYIITDVDEIYASERRKCCGIADRRQNPLGR